MNIVAEFKENVWRRLADLKQGRDAHSSIMVGGDSMIIGGHGSVLSVIIYHFTIKTYADNYGYLVFMLNMIQKFGCLKLATIKLLNRILQIILLV